MAAEGTVHITRNTTVGLQGAGIYKLDGSLPFDSLCLRLDRLSALAGAPPGTIMDHGLGFRV